MHVASVMVFEGVAPTPKELTDHVLSRLHLVPRYRERLAYVSLHQGRALGTGLPPLSPRAACCERTIHAPPRATTFATRRCRAPPTRPRSSGSPGACSPSAW